MKKMMKQGEGLRDEQIDYPLNVNGLFTLVYTKKRARD
jgi:hypothetical protein